jgi:hypothetical protein
MIGQGFPARSLIPLSLNNLFVHVAITQVSKSIGFVLGAAA